MKSEEFRTSHNLKFEVAPFYERIFRYRVGTCHGQWFTTENAYHILSVMNENPGNGHLDDVFEWFENSCRRDRRNLIVMEFFNKKFKSHCINKRGFRPIPDSDDLIKHL